MTKKKKYTRRREVTLESVITEQLEKVPGVCCTFQSCQQRVRVREDDFVGLCPWLGQRSLGHQGREWQQCNVGQKYHTQLTTRKHLHQRTVIWRKGNRHDREFI